MPEFVPRPNLPEGLAAQLIQMLQVNPWARAVESLGQSFGGALQRRGELAAQKERETAKAQSEATQAHAGDVTRLALEGQLAPTLMAQLGMPMPGLGGFSRAVPGSATGRLDLPMTAPVIPEGALNFTTDDLARMRGIAPMGPTMALKPKTKEVKELTPLEKHLKEADLALTNARKETELSRKREIDRRPGGDTSKDDKRIGRLIQVWGALRTERRAREKELGPSGDFTVIDERLRGLETEIGNAGIPISSSLEQDLETGRRAVAAGRLSEEDFARSIEKAYPSMAGKLVGKAAKGGGAKTAILRALLSISGMSPGGVK